MSVQCTVPHTHTHTQREREREGERERERERENQSLWAKVCCSFTHYITVENIENALKCLNPENRVELVHYNI